MGKEIKLGLRENIYQFSLLVIVNAFVGAMVGLERTLLPEIAKKDFHFIAKTAVLSFILVLGVRPAIYLVATLTFLSGIVVVFRMRETLRAQK